MDSNVSDKYLNKYLSANCTVNIVFTNTFFTVSKCVKLMYFVFLNTHFQIHF